MFDLIPFNSISITKACEFLNEKMPEDSEIENVLAEFHLTGEQVFKDIQKVLSNRKTNSIGNAQLAPMDVDDQSNEKENQSTTNARGSRASKATTSKAAASKTAASKTPAATSGRGRGSTRGRAAAGPSARNEPNVSVKQVIFRLVSIKWIKTEIVFFLFQARSQQQTIQQSLGRRTARSTRVPTYEVDDSD